MNTNNVLIAAAATILLGLTAAAATALFAAEPAGGSAKGEGKGTLYHVVSFKFKESIPPEQIAKVEQAFGALKDQVPGIETLHWGTNVSPEKHAKGFTHCFVLTFKSEKDRDAYLVHPDHEAFGKLVGPTLGDVFVIDFWAK